MSWIIASGVLFATLIYVTALLIRYKMKYVKEAYDNYSLHSYMVCIMEILQDLSKECDNEIIKYNVDKIIEKDFVMINSQMLANRGFKKYKEHGGYIYNVYKDVKLWFPMEKDKENLCHLLYIQNEEAVPVVVSTFNIMTKYHLKTLMRYFENRIQSEYKKISKKYYLSKKLKSDI